MSFVRRLVHALARRKARVIPFALVAISGGALAAIGLVRGDWWVLGFALLGVAGVLATLLQWIARRPEITGLIRRLPGGERLAGFLRGRGRARRKKLAARLESEVLALRDARHELEAAWLLLRSPERRDINMSVVRRVAADLRRRGYLDQARALLAEVVMKRGAAADAEQLRGLDAEVALLRGQRLPRIDAEPLEDLVPGRVLHVVKRSLADAQAGYTLRTHRTAVAQTRLGRDVHVVTQLGIHDPAAEETRWRQDGVTYHRLAGPSQRDLAHDEWFRGHVAALRDLVRDLRPEVLHAASDFVNARAARLVGNALGIPVVYEVRGFWEETLISSLSRRFGWLPLDEHERRYGMPETYRWRRAAEEHEWRNADAVVTLAPVMADKIAAAGVPRDRISIVPNAIDPVEFTPIPRDRALLRDLGFRDDTSVIGYVSSLSEYEGVDVLIRAFARLRGDARPGGIGLLIVGDGGDRPRLEEVAADVGAEGIVFTGRVPHDDVARYYSVIDVFVVPRQPVSVCRLVTPLKPYEAFALERAVVMSDVEALAGIASESGSALLAKAGDDQDLARVLARVLEDDEDRYRMAARAREWVIRERTWEMNAQRYEQVYGALTRTGTRSHPT